jgi:glycogen phosphorylase/synthase
MWERFRLDSISGHWDYVEPVLFGYAAGKLIESFVRFNTGSAERILAHFHEWMTGSGVLYPQGQGTCRDNNVYNPCHSYGPLTGR